VLLVLLVPLWLLLLAANDDGGGGGDGYWDEGITHVCPAIQSTSQRVQCQCDVSDSHEREGESEINPTTN
jgi:hypothetical protein